MKFTCSVDIDAPIDRVFELFDNQENMKKWQPDLLSIEHLSGTPRQPGAKSRLKYKNGKHEFDLIETIIENTPPHKFSGEYETEGVCWNTMKSSFTQIGENKTRYQASIEYKFYGLMVRIMALIMPWVFRKQVQKYLDNFKAFVETETKTV